MSKRRKYEVEGRHYGFWRVNKETFFFWGKNGFTKSDVNLDPQTVDPLVKGSGIGFVVTVNK